MELNKEQQEKVLEKIKNFWENRICEICNNTTWSLDKKLFVSKEYHGIFNTNNEKEYIQPILLISCNNCGNIKTFNATILEVIDNKSGELNNKLL